MLTLREFCNKAGAWPFEPEGVIYYDKPVSEVWAYGCSLWRIWLATREGVLPEHALIRFAFACERMVPDRVLSHIAEFLRKPDLVLAKDAAPEYPVALAAYATHLLDELRELQEMFDYRMTLQDLVWSNALACAVEPEEGVLGSRIGRRLARQLQYIGENFTPKLGE